MLNYSILKPKDTNKLNNFVNPIKQIALLIFRSKILYLCLSIVLVLIILTSAVSKIAFSKTIEYNKPDQPYDNNMLFEEVFNQDFETERLIATRTSKQDISTLADLLLDKNITYQLDPTLIDGFANKDEAINFLMEELSADNRYCFTIKLKQSDLPIGQISFSYTEQMLMPSYWIGTDYQNKGYASEIALPLTNKIFKSLDDIKMLYIACDYENLKSCKLAEKICNFINRNKIYEYSQDEGYTSAQIGDKIFKLHYKSFKLIKK